MWPESLGPICSRCKFGEKICYNSKDIKLFPGDYFFGAPCRFQLIGIGLLLFRSTFVLTPGSLQPVGVNNNKNNNK